ncbi:MAG: hypothetical protein V4773_16645 [Verrucomicrobiota bacterium]
MPDNETHLGDGLYASMDAGMIRLRAPRMGGDHVVYLDFDVTLAFARWMHEQKIVLPKFEEP